LRLESRFRQGSREQFSNQPRVVGVIDIGILLEQNALDRRHRSHEESVMSKTAGTVLRASRLRKGLVGR